MLDRKPHDIFGTSVLLKDYFKANIYILNRQKYLEENATFVCAINVKCELPKTFSTWGDGSGLHPWGPTFTIIILCLRENRMGKLVKS